ncbi:alpha/beta hydrolase [Rhodoblastus sphagnicola]|nr:alpha/beta hydrolase [Rhodoblastus sphagnicola]
MRFSRATRGALFLRMSGGPSFRRREEADAQLAVERLHMKARLSPALNSRLLEMRLLWLGLVVLLAGCAMRPETGYLGSSTAFESGSTRHDILVATTRKRDERSDTLFGTDRAAGLDFADVSISVPPNHVTGEVEWPDSPPGDPKTDFTVRKASYLPSERDFLEKLNARLRRERPENRRVILYIHGFNTFFSEAVYTTAQISHDAAFPGVPVVFSWASRGNVFDYGYDNNSANAARADLARVLKLLLQSDANKVSIVAHSLGNWLFMESIIQLKLSGFTSNLSKVDLVFLASPDIDFDVFKSQLRQLGKPPVPYYVIISRDDQALSLSSLIAGGRPRLGAYGDANELTSLGATVIDVSDVKGMDPANHDKFTLLAGVAPQLVRSLGRMQPPSGATQTERARRADSNGSQGPFPILSIGGGNVNIMPGQVH